MKRVVHLLDGMMVGGFVMLACNVSVAATPSPIAAQKPANVYLFNSVAYSRPMNISSGDTATDIGQAFGGIRSLLPVVPPLGEVAVLPRIKKVQPTGEKPLYVLTFKCPTEVVGISPPPTKLLHNLVTAGMDAMNGANLLPFNMQQVCQ